MAKLSQEQIDELKEAFGAKDPIPSEQLGPVMRQLGQVMTDVELKEMAQKCGGASVSFKSFCDCVQTMLAPPSNIDAVRQAFAVFDKEGKGVVSGKELKHVMTTLGEKLTAAEVDALFKEAGIAENGQVNIQDFMKKMTTL